jgi:hypothetical protein
VNLEYPKGTILCLDDRSHLVFESLSTANTAKLAFCSPASRSSDEEPSPGPPGQVMHWRIFTEQIYIGGFIP